MMHNSEEAWSLLLLQKQQTRILKTSHHVLFVFLGIAVVRIVKSFDRLSDGIYLSTTKRITPRELQIIINTSLFATAALFLYLKFEGYRIQNEFIQLRRKLSGLNNSQKQLLGLDDKLHKLLEPHDIPDNKERKTGIRSRKVVYTPVSEKSSKAIRSQYGSGSKDNRLIGSSPRVYSPVLVPQKARELGLVSLDGRDEEWIGTSAALERHLAETESEKKTTPTFNFPKAGRGGNIFDVSSQRFTSPTGFALFQNPESPLQTVRTYSTPTDTSPAFSLHDSVLRSPKSQHPQHRGAIQTSIQPNLFQLKSSTPQKILEDEAAYKLLEELRVDWLSNIPVSHVIEEWTDNLRRGLRNHIKNVLALIERNSKQLKELLGDAIKKSFLQYENEDSPQSETYESIIARAFQFCVQTNNLQGYNSLNQLIQERKSLERYLVVQRHSTLFLKGYVLNRLKSLSNSGDLMPKFSWNSGDRWNGMSWQAEKFPTDAEIIMHVMLAWFDDTLKSSFTPSNTVYDQNTSTFVKYHMRYTTTSDLSQLSESQYWGFINATNEMSIANTHYKVMVRGNLWQVRSGRQNVFHAILLFLYSLKKKKVAGIEVHEKIIGGRAY